MLSIHKETKEGDVSRTVTEHALSVTVATQHYESAELLFV
jgi:hypothetical protein